MSIGSAPGELVACATIRCFTDELVPGSIGIGNFSVASPQAWWKFNLTGSATQRPEQLTPIATITGGIVGSPFRVALLLESDPASNEWTVYAINPANGYPQALTTPCLLHVAFYRAAPAGA